VNLYVYVHLSVCPRERDARFGIQWGYTAPGETSVQSCGANYTGKHMHKQSINVNWVINVRSLMILIGG